MEFIEQTIELGKLVTAFIAVVGAIWAFWKWRVRDEHFPRMEFETGANYIGEKDGNLVYELFATLENKGVVPLKFKDFTFVLRGISASDALVDGGEEIRNQLNFSRVLRHGDFIPKKWPYSFISPGVRTEYNYVTTIPKDTVFMRMQADFIYPDRDDESHHAAKIIAVAATPK